MSEKHWFYSFLVVSGERVILVLVTLSWLKNKGVSTSSLEFDLAKSGT